MPIGPAREQEGQRGPEGEGADVAPHGEAASPRGEALGDHAHARHVGARESQADGAAQDDGGEEALRPEGEGEAGRGHPEGTPEIDATRRHVVRQRGQDHDRADVPELVEGHDEPGLTVAEVPLALKEREQGGEVREDF